MRIRRRYLLTKIVLIIIIFAAVTALAIYVAHLAERDLAEMQRDVSCSEETTASASADKPEMTETPAPAASRIRCENDPYLVLVNFDHEYTGNPRLVPNSYVFDERFCTFCNRSCDETAGRALNEMFAAGVKAGYGPFIVNSSFRDRSEQRKIWEDKLRDDPDYGKSPYESPVRAMPPGMSEHETGLAFDVLTEEHPFANKWFGTFPDGIWLRENCARYGFILRYPEDKTHVTGVMYEPWHFRYVGVEAAEYMYEHGLCLEELWEEGWST